MARVPSEEIVGLCPFCGAEGRTLVITAADNTWRCDAGCQAAGGRVLDWVMRAEGVSRRARSGTNNKWSDRNHESP